MPGEVVVDHRLCLGCKSCEIACAVEHSAGRELLAAISQSLPPGKRIFVCAAGKSSVPLNCRHCEDPPCARVCPAGALHLESGLVVHEPGRCLGCGACQLVCPFGVITRLPGSKIVAKCDRCADRPGPACVEACPTGALRFGDPGEAAASRRRQAAAQLVEK